MGDIVFDFSGVEHLLDAQIVQFDELQLWLMEAFMRLDGTYSVMIFALGSIAGILLVGQFLKGLRL